MKQAREMLYKALPLKKPFLVQIFPCAACNFKCQYCIHALPVEKGGPISGKQLMSMETYKSIIDDLKGSRIKMLRFAGLGEPLLHPEIAEMIDYAARLQAAEKIDIVTNGSILTPELSDKLINAGLSTLRVSLEGLSSEEYAENAGARVDFDKLVGNIRYFYERSQNTIVYVKIIDYMLKNDEEREKRFYSVFRPISHITSVEHLTPTVEGIDYDSFSNGLDYALTQEGDKKGNVEICPQPFYMIQCNPDGTFAPCCNVKYPVVFPESAKLSETWNSEAFNKFRRTFLSGNKVDVCAECTLYQYGIHSEDILDDHKEELLKAFI